MVPPSKLVGVHSGTEHILCTITYLQVNKSLTTETLVTGSVVLSHTRRRPCGLHAISLYSHVLSSRYLRTSRTDVDTHVEVGYLLDRPEDDIVTLVRQCHVNSKFLLLRYGQSRKKEVGKFIRILRGVRATVRWVRESN